MQWVTLLLILLFFNLLVYKCQPNVIIARLDDGQFDALQDDQGDSTKEGQQGQTSPAVSANEVEMTEATEATVNGETGSTAETNPNPLSEASDAMKGDSSREKLQ